MTSRQIELVQDSFRRVQPALETAASTFYDRLFELDPSLSSLFHRPRAEQSRMLAQALALVVAGIDRPERIRAAVEALGRRHSGYGVRDEHYATVGEALLWTLREGLGEAFTPEVSEAWGAAYAWLASAMMEAAAAGGVSEAPVAGRPATAAA